MKISDHVRFVHPVLSAETKDFGDFKFNLDVQVYEVPSTSELSLRCTIDTDHPNFAKALGNGTIACYANVVCLETYYNEFHELTSETTDISIPPGLLRGRTSLKAICVTREEIDVSQWEDVHDEFSAPSCAISPCSVIGLSEEFLIEVGLDKLRPFESIFRLVKQDSLNDDVIAVDVDSQYICIAASPSLYSTITALRNAPTTRDILLNSVYFSATFEVLALVGNDPDGFDDKWWFRVFRARCTRLGVDIEETDLLEGTQVLLNQPLQRLHKLQELME